LTRTIPRLYDYARKHSEWQTLKLAFEFWTTGRLSEAARKRVAAVAGQIRPTNHTVRVRQTDQIREVACSVQDNALLRIFNEHFVEHPLATVAVSSSDATQRPHGLAGHESRQEGGILRIQSGTRQSGHPQKFDE